MPEHIPGKPAPTMHLRFVPRRTITSGSWPHGTTIHVLQQLHIHPDKGEIWLDVPFFNETAE